MKRLRSKLKDQCGASILLALLFFLLCAVVGASVLMAAVSNAGKIRSNREEQQKYLLLSSALRLVCGELTKAEYYGKYAYTSWTDEIIIDHTAEGDPITETHTHHKYTQKQGDFQCSLKDVLPLAWELDHIFASKFPASYVSVDGLVHYSYVPLYTVPIPATPRELTLSVGAPGAEVPDGLKEKVTVTVELDEDLRIRLTATLGTAEADGYIYTMEALLACQGDLGLAAPGSAVDIDGDGVYEAGPVTWTLEFIKKEAGGGV